jgi:hypothetical protein
LQFIALGRKFGPLESGTYALFWTRAISNSFGIRWFRTLRKMMGGGG